MPGVLTASRNLAILLNSMADAYTTKPLTLETLEKYNKKVLLPEIKGIVDERMQHYTNESLNDR